MLKVPPAHSLVAIPVRQVFDHIGPSFANVSLTYTVQAMLKSLYDHFVILYHKILPVNPTIASEHSLRQEQEVYNKSTKLTYRNVRYTRGNPKIHHLSYLSDCNFQHSVSQEARCTPVRWRSNCWDGGRPRRTDRSQKGYTVPSTDSFPPSTVPSFKRGHDHLGVCG